MKRLLAQVALAAIWWLAVSVQVVLAGTIYWGDARGLQRCDLDGSGRETVVPTPGVTPTAVAVDASGGKVYWTVLLPTYEPAGGFGSFPVGAVFRANLDGSQVQQVATASSPMGIALRPNAGKIYWTDIWTDTWTGEVRTANLDGSQPETLVSGLRAPGGIDVEQSGGKLVWAVYVPPLNPGQELYVLQRANLDGSDVQTLPPSLYGLATDVAVDPLAGKLYWSYVNPLIDGLFPGSIMRSNLDGSDAEPVVSGLLSPQGIALDPAGGKLYFIDVGHAAEGAIYRANLDGSQKEVILEDLDYPRGIALDLTPIPEPHGMVLLAIGGLTVLWRALRRR